MLRRLTLACLLVNLLVSLLPSFALASTTDDTAQTAVITIGTLRQEIATHQEKVGQAEKEERSLLDELAMLDNKLRQQKAKITALETKIKEQDGVIAAKGQELAVLTKKNKALQQHLLKRLRSFYLLGKTGFLAIVFSKDTIPELMLANDAFRLLSIYDQAVFAQYRAQVTAINQVNQACRLEQSMQVHFLAESAREQDLLQQVVAEKNTLLRRIKAEKSLYSQAIREMKKAVGSLLATLEKPGKVNASQERRSGGFLGQKKKLPPPVWGKIIRNFQEPAANKDTTFANGITIQPPEQAEVFAVYGGVVIYSGYMSGYGRIVIIEHGQQFHTVTAQLDDILVIEGDAVKQGQIIGTSTKVANLFGRGLYFEIRRGAQPENPLEWIQPGALAQR